MNAFIKVVVIVSLACLFQANNLFAQDEAAELAKKLANPVASLISVPLQNNSDFGIGSLKGSRNTMNIQPVVPISLNPKLNLIARVIIPVMTQYNISGEGQRQTGIGDAVLSGFLSPNDSKNGFTWGAGPAFLLPIGSAEFTAHKFGIGPTAVALKQQAGWTYGALINQIWTLGDESDNLNMSQMFLQPFLVHNWKTGAGIGGNLEWTFNWTANTNVLWFNPILSGVTALGKQKVQLVIGPRFNLAAPTGGKADWGFRSVIVFLFPK